jgi:HSP20 family protein
MSIIPWKNKRDIAVRRNEWPGTLFSDFRTEIDDLFERFLGERWTGRRGDLNWAWPTVDVSETDGAITIRAEMPGIEKDDLKVTLSGNVLSISGEKKESSEDRGADYWHSERRFGTFRRSIELPEGADLGKIDARQENGVLTISVPKVPAASSKRIEVKSGAVKQSGSAAGTKVPVGVGSR